MLKQLCLAVAATVAAPYIGISGTSAFAAEASGRVGEVVMVIGAPRMTDGRGNTSQVVKGMSVHVADRIETGAGAHAIVRFVDGASVSVRPNSRLMVETYQYDAAAPKSSAVKLQLEEGIARSITGKAGENAKERFRLNTPIAAIGVKGTDFIVSSKADQVRVAVQSGAVVVAPFSASCRAEGFGPCTTDTARTLTQEMVGMVLEMRRSQGVPSVKTEVAQISPPAKADSLRPASATASPTESLDAPKAASSETPSQTQASSTVIALLNDQTPLPVAPSVPEKPIVPTPPAVVEPVQPPTPPVVGTPAPTPVITLPAPQPGLTPATMAWGRWSWAVALPGESIAGTFAEASAGKTITVSNQNFGLFREPGLAPSVLPAQLGTVEFALRTAEAQFVNSGKIDTAAVKGGTLFLDFASARFATALSLNHTSTGDVIFQSFGKVSNTGLFASTPGSGNGSVSGALSLNGKEAGYLFEHLTNGGTFQGLTLWSR